MKVAQLVEQLSDLPQDAEVEGEFRGEQIFLNAIDIATDDHVVVLYMVEELNF